MHIARFVAYCVAAAHSLAAFSFAQVIHVPGDFATIQDALDAAPAGALVIIHGGTWDTITIRRSVSLIGQPPPVLDGRFGAVSPIILSGGGSGDVTLSRIRAGTYVPDDLAPPRPSPAISGGGFDELHVYDSEIMAPQRSPGDFDGLGYGNSAIDVDVPLVVLERSAVKGGGAGINDACTGNSPAWIPPAAVQVSGTLIVLDSSLQGGDMGSFQYFDWPGPTDCDPANCPYFPGGAGVSCAALFHSGSSFLGGRGARWSTCFPSVFCCESPPGAAIQAGQVSPLTNDLFGDRRIHLGDRYSIHLGSPGPLVHLYVADQMRVPIQTRRGWVFLGPGGIQSVGIFPSPGQAVFAVPNDPTLLGRPVAFQGVDSTQALTRPVCAVVLDSLLDKSAPGGPISTVPRTTTRPRLTFEFPNGVPEFIGPGGGVVRFEVIENTVGDLQAGTVKFRYSTGGVFTAVNATALGYGLYEAVMPAVPCGAPLDFYVSASSRDNVTWTDPSTAPAQLHQAVAAYGKILVFDDRMEADMGWSVDLAADLTGFSTATLGTWVRVDPIGTSAQAEDDHTPPLGAFAWVTGQGVTGGSVSDADIDGGATTLRSPVLDASGLNDPQISYWRWFSNNQGSAPGADNMKVDISNDGGSSWVLLETVGPTGPDAVGGWIEHSVRIADFVTPTNNMRLRFRAKDFFLDSVVEAAIDDLMIVDWDCTPP